MPADRREEFPHLAKFWPYIDLLREESDRGRVLISTGYMEEQLKDVLLAFMLDTASAKELLTSGNAPLGTFSARIAACYSFGLISELEHSDLTLMRKIRNEFAHNILTSFQTPSVVDRCKALHYKIGDYPLKGTGEVITDPMAQFTSAAAAIILHLTNRPHYVGLKRCEYGAWPY